MVDHVKLVECADVSLHESVKGGLIRMDRSKPFLGFKGRPLELAVPN